MADHQQKHSIIDNPAAPTIFADKFITLSVDTAGGNFVVTLGETRFLPKRIGDTPKPGEHPAVHVVARIALAPNATIELVNNLTQMLEAIGAKKEGAKPAQEPGKPH